MALPGPFLAGQRLTAGQLNDATQKTLDSVEVGTSGIINSGITTTETNIPKLAMGPIALVAGGLYQVKLRLILQQSVASDEFLCIVRRDTALTGTVVTEFFIGAPVTTAGFMMVEWDDFTSASDESGVPFYVSLKRSAGSGNIQIYGQLNGDNRTGAKLSRVGYSSEFRVVT